MAVVGGGIVGLTTALQAAQGGASVALLEARRLGSGASGLNTAKLSSLHGLTYAELISTQGEELARLYGEANQRGIERVVTLTEELGIDCELRRKPHVVYSEDPGRREDLEDEVAAAKRLGLPASFERDTDLPFGVAGAVAFAAQAEFHPLRYLEGIAAAAEEAGVEIYERSRVGGVDFSEPARVSTLHGPAVTARHVVLTTHLPFVTRGLYFARAHPERSYVVAGLVPEGPAGMYLSASSPPRARSGCTRPVASAGCSWAGRATRPGRATGSPATSAWRAGRRSASG